MQKARAGHSNTGALHRLWRGALARLAHIETRIYALGGERDGAITADTFVYKPLVYQTFIPAAAAGE